MTGTLLSRRQIVVLFLAALSIRLAYLGVVLMLDGNIDNGSDSGKFIQLAKNLREYGALINWNFDKGNWDFGVLGPDAARMPLYPYFLAGVLQIFGESSLWLVAVIQAVVDATTIFAIALIAGAIDRRWALPAALVACVWTTMIVYSSFVLTDTLFLAFLCWGLCACVWAARSERKVTLLAAAGAAFGLAVQTRPTLIFFPFFLVPALAGLLWAVSRLRWRRAIVLAAIPALIMVATLVPRVANNYILFGSPIITTQSGNHAIQVVESYIRLCPECVADRQQEKMQIAIREKLAARSPADRRNLVILDGIRREVALEYLRELPIGVLVRGTIVAAIRSTAQTGLYETGHQLNLDPTFLSSIPGPTLQARIAGFGLAIFTDRFLFVWALAQSAALLGVALQFTGAVDGIRDPGARPYILFLLAIGAYFLAVNGPFGNPRYGMPLTPALIVLTASGGLAVLDRFARRRRTAGQT